MTKKIPCLITTDKRGVFMGYIDPKDAKNKDIEAEEIRMVFRWSEEVRGVVSLAANGPTKNCRVTAAAPKGILHGVTAVLECTPKAEKAFKSEPWA
jgi:hypothetical protein